jgi:mannose-6-phosphate isomerase-like protein (cupin superfamily)
VTAKAVVKSTRRDQMPYQVNVVSAAQSNEDFRRVLFTGQQSQLVVMTIPPGGEVGDERHDHVEQTLFCLSGNGTAILDGARSPFASGDAVVVTPGTRHNFLNTGTEPLRIYTIYAPPNHIDGRVHRTKADADADHADEEFGHSVGG